MTLLQTEGFDWLQTSDLTAAYSAYSVYEAGDSGTPTHTIESGRTGNAHQISITSGGTAGRRNVALCSIVMTASSISAGGQGIFGFAFKFSVHNINELVFCVIDNGAASTATRMNLILARTAAGTISAGTTSGLSDLVMTTVFGTGTAILGAGVWNYIAVKFTPHASAGIVEVKVNGIADITLSGLDTVLDNNTWSSINLGGNNPDQATVELTYDDYYLNDDNGSTNNDFLGDIQIITIKPDGNGNSSDLVGSDADSTDNHLLVDDGGAIDDDTTYVESNFIGDKDTYAYGSVSNTGTIFGATVKTVAKKIGGGGRDVQSVARSVAAETNSSNLGMTTDYTMKANVYETDPATGAAWGLTALNAAEFGVEIGTP